MVVAKHPSDQIPCYIPFGTKGIGRILITKKLLDELYTKESDEKVKAAVFVDAPDFEDEDSEFEDFKVKLQEHWKNEIGSLLLSLERIGVRKTFIVYPHWYFNLNWEGIKTITTLTNIAHDVYIQDVPDVEFEWHFDARSPPVNLKAEEPLQLTHSVQLTDLKVTDEFKSDTNVETTVWVIDSEINYSHLNGQETRKVFPSYYECSSDDDLYESKQHVSNEDTCKDEYKHGTLMCKVVSAISSRQTVIQVVKCPKLGNNFSHIDRCLLYIKLKARELKSKGNVILMTLGTLKFRATNPNLPVYETHKRLHKKDFLFICSAGNVKFPKNDAVPRPKIPQYPTSFFANCKSCFVVGSHGHTDSSKVPCVPSSFGSSGCCTPDRESDQSFIQGVHTLAIGENVLVAKTKHQENDQIINGTSVAAAVVAASITYFLPKLSNPIQNLYSDKIKKLKGLMEKSSDVFLCPEHGRSPVPS